MGTLGAGAREFGVELGASQLERFEAYYRHLIEWNARFNLTAITGDDEVQVKHFLDSLSVARALPREPLDARAASLIDIGAGAGFPGVPLAIAFPHLRVTLLEATHKKVVFLDALIQELELDNVAAVHARAEELAHEPAHREQYDFAVARAVGELRTLVEYALPFVRVGGVFVAQKGRDAEQETGAAARALRTLGGSPRALIPIHLPTISEVRYLVVVDKLAQTPARYPRRAGMAAKRPL